MITTPRRTPDEMVPLLTRLVSVPLTLTPICCPVAIVPRFC
ncbi:hypothetical protein [Polaromonas sp. YR568]